MKKQNTRDVKAHLLRGAFYLLLFVGLVVVVALSAAINMPSPASKFSTWQDNLAFGKVRESASSVAASATRKNQTLTFADRVAYQRAIEEVSWRHRIWPKENPNPKPSLDAVMSQAQLEKKVTDYLQKSQALEDYWQRPIAAEQLQAEMDRMAQHTKQPEVLRELFAALRNDPFVIAECLARPALADRLLTSWYAYDQRIHGELKYRAEADLLAQPSVAQMKQTSGTYSEIELVRGDTTPEGRGRAARHLAKLNTRDWDEKIERLAAQFERPNIVAQAPRLPDQQPAAAAAALQPHNSQVDAKRLDAWSRIRLAALSPLQEDEVRYYATAVIEKTNDHLKLATVSWPKERLDSWLAKAENQTPELLTVPDASYRLPTISGGAGCIDDTWTATADAPPGREWHTAVWTGTEMIIWGGFDRLNTGWRYNPSTDRWLVISTTNAPAGRESHTAVWSGNEMIVWGGYNGSELNSGGRYNPGTDSWTATSTTNAPTGRESHTAVWTGSEMIVWGGYGGGNTGGRYNPNTDSWTATSVTNAPDARDMHTAVWTGSEMIVWGGFNGNPPLNTGGKYNPITDSWTATSRTNTPT